MDSADSIEKHVQDTLMAGAGLCDESVVRTIIEEALNRYVTWSMEERPSHLKVANCTWAGRVDTRLIASYTLQMRRVKSSSFLCWIA